MTTKLINNSIEFLNELRKSNYTIEEYMRLFYKTTNRPKFFISLDTSSDFGRPIGKDNQVRRRYF